MSEKLCIFCIHFVWEKESMWGMGGTMTGPMMEGGSATCAKKHQWECGGFPEDEKDFRRIILKAKTCPDYEQVQP
jgi:hypothetical protein